MKASAYGSKLGRPAAVLHKERLDGAKTVRNRIVADVDGKSCLIIDDMISVGGTIKNALEALLKASATQQMIVAARHPVFTGEAKQNLNHIAGARSSRGALRPERK